MNSKLGQSIVALVAVAALATALWQPRTERVVERVIQENKEELGSVTGPEVSGNEFTVGGVRLRYVSQTMNTGTSTTCILAGPTATSTLIRAQGILINGTTTGQYEIYKVIGGIATTSGNLLLTQSARNSTAFFGSTTMPTLLGQVTQSLDHVATGTNNLVFTVRGVGSENGKFWGAGKCEAVWETSLR